MTPIVSTIILASIISPADNGMWQMNDLAYDNPAVKQWMLPSTFNSIDIGYHKDTSSLAVDVPGYGTGSDFWNAEANSYMKYKSSTLWGAASYKNGHLRDVTWNETSDASLIYPYFTADSVGGDFSMEQYAFSGGYGDQTDKWAWGVSLGYTAGLYYRNVDPRPKNITGKLDIAVGGGIKIIDNRYFLGASFNWMKYKQSNDIDFKSQIGVEKIYHLTGLGTHYSRFDGTGTDVYYSGNRPCINLNFFPTSGSGLVATAELSQFNCNKILTDLNKLPLAHISHKALDAQLGWLSYGKTNDWAATATLNLYRRHGTENIFGDASSSIYPQIGELMMYADNSATINLSGLWQHRWTDKMILWIRPDIEYFHRTTAYREPVRYMTLNDFSAGVTASISSKLSAKWNAALVASYKAIMPFDAELVMPETDSDISSLTSAIDHSYNFASNDINKFSLEAKFSRTINARSEIILSAAWNRTSYCESVNRNDYDIRLALTF
jgi:hypothetical protein